MMADELIPFQIKAITTQEFATIQSVYKEEEEIGISTGFKFGIDNENHAIAVFLELAFECDGNPFVILKTRMEFEVEPKVFDKLKNKESKVVTIPKNFLAHLSAMTVSTSRGILHTKLENTDFDFLLLPSLNVSEIIQEDLKLEL